jgi:hypothetical protein
MTNNLQPNIREIFSQISDSFINGSGKLNMGFVVNFIISLWSVEKHDVIIQNNLKFRTAI